LTLLGTDLNQHHGVALSPEGRRQGTYILGINGTGKSNLLLNIALQDIQSGEGVCLMDPHGDLVDAVLRRVPRDRVDDVILFDPSDIDHPFGLNMFECQDPSNPRLVDRICSEVVLTFKKLFSDSWGPRMEDIIRHTVLTLIATPGCTMLDMLPMLTDSSRRREYVSRTSDPVIRHYWERTFPQNERTASEWTASTLNKLGRFLTNPVVRNIVAQPKSTFDFRDVMDSGKVLLVNLSKGKLGEDNASLIGSTLVGKILIAAMSRAELPQAERRPFHLIVDEYHSFATESFPTLQSEARKFSIDTIVAHQYRDQLDDLNRGSTLNVGNFIIFRVSGRDARELAMQFDNAPPIAEAKLQQVPYPTGRDGVYRTSGDKMYVPGNARSYSDVEHETANFLTNAPNYRAYCKFIENGDLVEYHIATNPAPADVTPNAADDIVKNSQRLAGRREDVERRVLDMWAEHVEPIPTAAHDGRRPARKGDSSTVD
jgi:hypothetical protein